jgi:chemotaxis protein methyltransferase CheR
MPPNTQIGWDIPQLSAAEFARFQSFVREHTGIHLRENKRHLLVSRLAQHLRSLNLENFSDYYEYLVSDTSGEELRTFINRVTTNKTSFFRESHHFDFLREHLTSRAQRTGPGPLRIWSAACSTGEEPYSLAFTICDQWGADGFRKVRILATDISTRALAAAQNAVYPAERFSALPPAWLHQFLRRGEGRRKGWYRIKSELRSQIEFARLNLIEAFSHHSSFPVIFCRNVMIYFDKATQETLVNRLASSLEPGGYLFIGHAESLSGVRHGLNYVCPAIYQKPGSSAGKVPR